MGLETNFTVTVPVGTTNHGDPHLVCTPPKWHDYIVFFSLNYFIHAATIPSLPGQTPFETLFNVVNALFVPAYGIMRALRRLILRPVLLRKHPLDCAGASGALAMVVKKTVFSGSQPDHWTKQTFRAPEDLSSHTCPINRTVHGLCRLPSGYALCVVPPGLEFAPQTASTGPNGEPKEAVAFQPAGQHSIIKVLFSLLQAIGGGVTIYRSRGDQIQQYGYAAFGLSTIPYFFMSVVNFTALLFGPEYSSMYLVHTPDMDDAVREGGYFEGVVGAVNDRPTKRIDVDWDLQSRWQQLSIAVLFVLLVMTPLGIVGGLSSFHTGSSSTAAQRGWIMSWFVVGCLSSAFAAVVRITLQNSPKETLEDLIVAMLLCSGPFWIPAIGGMVIVGLELRDYGICSRLS
jgi:hypothetical protein